MYNLEKNSNHPISTAIVQKVENDNAKINKTVENHEEIAGHGIYAKVDGKDILFGNKKLLEKYDVSTQNIQENINYLVIDGDIAGYITLKEEIRNDAKDITNKFE